MRSHCGQRHCPSNLCNGCSCPELLGKCLQDPGVTLREESWALPRHFYAFLPLWLFLRKLLISGGQTEQSIYLSSGNSSSPLMDLWLGLKNWQFVAQRSESLVSWTRVWWLEQEAVTWLCPWPMGPVLVPGIPEPSGFTLTPNSEVPQRTVWCERVPHLLGKDG